MRFLLLLVAALMPAQDGTSVNLSQGPPYVGYQRLMFYSGSNLEYVCYSKNVAPQTRITISAITAATPGVLTSVGHGFELGTRARVTIAGATGDWAEANGIWLVEPTDADTFTLRDITTGTQLDTAGNAGGIGTVTLTTTAPRSTAYHWQIAKFRYDGSSNITATVWAVGGTGGVSNNRCSDRAATWMEWR